MKFVDLPAHQRAEIEAQANAPISDYCPVCDLTFAEVEGALGCQFPDDPEPGEEDECLSMAISDRDLARRSMRSDADLMTLDEYVRREQPPAA